MVGRVWRSTRDERVKWFCLLAFALADCWVGLHCLTCMTKNRVRN